MTSKPAGRDSGAVRLDRSGRPRPATACGPPIRPPDRRPGAPSLHSRDSGRLIVLFTGESDMRNRLILAVLFLTLFPYAPLHAQGIPSGRVGWYNGDWQSGISSPGNFYAWAQQFGRVYDDFVVPDGGWTVVGVFSHNNMGSTAVTQASWEIRSGVSAGNQGTLVASG